ncbi:MAG TPA: AI-2E family transporter [Candidatus Marinimicrobia bacterium]|nr:AI-2E family transporter [Candidatus Neomarinimicrobiota bacterium]
MDNTLNSGSGKVQQFLFTFAAFIIVIAGMRAAQDILIPFMLSVFIAVISHPLVVSLRARGIHTGFSILLVIFAIIAVGFGITSLLGTSLNDFTSNLPNYQKLLQDNAANFFAFLEEKGIALSGQAILERFDPGAAMSLTSTILSGLGSVLSNALLILLMVVFMLLEGTIFNHKLSQIFGGKKEKIDQIDSFSKTVKRYMLIKTGTSLATGIVATIWLSIIGVDYPLLWGFLTFLFNYVPTIGSIIAAVPPTLLALIQMGFFSAFLTGIGYIVINLIVGSFLEPRFMGKGLGISTLLVILSLIFWGWVFGPIGMVLSVPLTMTIKIALSNFEKTEWISTLMDDPKIGFSGTK